MTRFSTFLQSLIQHGLVDEPATEAMLMQFNTDFELATHLFGVFELPADRELIARLYGDSLGKAHIPLDKTLFQPEALAMIVPAMARKLQSIPVYFLDGVLTVAMAHPEDLQTVDYITKLIGHPVSPVCLSGELYPLHFLNHQ